MNTEGLHIAVLIKVRGPTAIRVGAVVLPDGREGTGTVVIVAYLRKGLSRVTIDGPSALTLKSR